MSLWPDIALAALLVVAGLLILVGYGAIGVSGQQSDEEEE